MTQEELSKLLEDAAHVEDIKAKMHTQFKDVKWPNAYLDAVWIGNGAEHLAEKWNAVVIDNGDEGMVFPNFVTDHYKLVPHEVITHMLMREVTSNWSHWGVPEFKVNLYDQGAKAFVRAFFPEMKEAKKLKIGKDVIEPFIGFKNSYDSQTQLTGTGGAVVFRCSNGMVSTKVLQHFKRKHRQGLSMDAVVKQLNTCIKTMEEEHELWRSWTKLMIEKAQAEEILEALPISEKQNEKILALPETGTGITLESMFNSGKPVSAWTMNSILTQWITHEVKDSSGRKEREEQMAFVLARHFDHLRN